MLVRLRPLLGARRGLRRDRRGVCCPPPYPPCLGSPRQGAGLGAGIAQADPAGEGEVTGSSACERRGNRGLLWQHRQPTLPLPRPPAHQGWPGPGNLPAASRRRWLGACGAVEGHSHPRRSRLPPTAQGTPPRRFVFLGSRWGGGEGDGSEAPPWRGSAAFAGAGRGSGPRVGDSPAGVQACAGAFFPAWSPTVSSDEEKRRSWKSSGPEHGLLCRCWLGLAPGAWSIASGNTQNRERLLLSPALRGTPVPGLLQD